MSRAFVKESDQETETLPERTLSPHPNLVSMRGLALLEERVRTLEAERAAARASGDDAARARIARDLRYFQARRDSARLVTPDLHPQQLRFGVRARLRAADGAEHRYQIVGEDEADPAAGLISYVSPLAAALLGGRVGDVVPFGGGALEILALESPS